MLREKVSIMEQRFVLNSELVQKEVGFRVVLQKIELFSFPSKIDSWFPSNLRKFCR